jgi:hypothetical protein
MLRSLNDIAIEINNELNIPVDDIADLLRRYEQLSSEYPRPSSEQFVQYYVELCEVERKIVSWLICHVPDDLMIEAVKRTASGEVRISDDDEEVSCDDEEALS